jgi:redox-sensitive bicupin YhaK (pirin superfamily)
MAGFQLWVNLPAKDKMCAPRYQDIPAGDVPVVSGESGATVKVLAGSYGGVEGPVKAVATDPTYLDVTLGPQGAFAISLEQSYTSFAYVFEGEVKFGEEGTLIKAGQLAVFSSGAGLKANGGNAGGRFILLAGKPLKEPIAQYGPFVMNSMDEIRQAVEDFQAGKF